MALLPRSAGRFKFGRPALRALGIAGIGALADGLTLSGFSAADFAVRLREPLARGVGFLFLALARVGRLRAWPGHLDDLSRLLPVSDFLPIALRSPHRFRGKSVRFTVGDIPAEFKPGTEGRVMFDYDHFNPVCSPNTVIAPFVLHPHYYASGLYRSLAGFRQPQRTIRIFFAGTANPESYSRSFPTDLFRMMNRSEVLAAVQEDFAGEVLVVRSREELPQIERSGRPIVLVLTDRIEDNLKKHLLEPREYLRLLGGSAFALCPPGWVIPHCHNLIEALAVGTVPILGYAEHCHPSLTGGSNCLTFNDREELRSAVRKALSMSESAAAQMRTEAATHYDSAVAVDAFAGRLAQALKNGGDVRVRFAYGEESVRLRTQAFNELS